MWLEGFVTALLPLNLAYLALGSAVGMLIGALPGLGPLFAVALMLPLTFGMPPATAIIFLTAVHAATAYGDSFASIVINTPGGVGSVASCWDGYPMAQKGQAGVAMGISTLGSFLGGIIGWISLVVLSPVLVWLALKMGPPEYFMVALVALSLLALAAGEEILKGLFLGAIGLLLSFVGRDPITAEARFTLGSLYLEDGVPLASVVLGLFALSQVLVLAGKTGSISQIRGVGKVREGFLLALRLPATILRAGVVGIVMGVLPALGLSSANVVAYFVEKKFSKHPETFGTGEPRGLLAPEIAKNACIVGDLIPTFALGIPGSAVTAIFLAAMVIHGIQPGAEFFTRSGALAYTIFAGVLLAQVSFFLMGLLFARQFAKVSLIPNAFLAPLIVVLSFVGSLALRGRMEDVVVTFVFGFVGYLFTMYRYPATCLVLGLVLGSLMESNFHRSLLISGGDYSIFFTRPISLGLFVLTLVMIIGPYLKSKIRFLHVISISLILLLGCQRSGGDFEDGMEALAQADYETAMRKWRPLAEAGDPAAQTNVGYLHYEGKGVPQNYEEGVKWYNLAASKGYPDACFNLAVAYAEGKGVERDPAQALKWYQVAADAGYAPAQVAVGNMYFRGVDVAQDREAGFQWYLKAAEQDDVVAQFFVANLYETGGGVAEDRIQAYKWLSIAEGGDHPDARKTAEERKELIAGIMTEAQIAEAEKQAREWVARNRVEKNQ